MYDKLRKIREAKAEDDRGFTLIELLVVVVIIGILIAIAIPLYLNYQKGAHDKSAQSDLKAAVTAIQQCFTDNGNAYPSAVTWASGVGTPTGTGTPNPCANDVLNTSSGTTIVYTLASGGASFTLAASNSSGHKNANAAALAAATGSGSDYYFYDSSAGGSIGG
jgi:type IV pilus assembly protein PilA